MSTREEDFVKEIHLADTHTKLLVFSSLGKVYALKSHDIPEAVSYTHLTLPTTPYE